MNARLTLIVSCAAVASVASGFPPSLRATARLAEAPVAREGRSRPVFAQQLTIWDGVFTTEQATRGEKIYAERCARCHGEGLQGVEAAPALTGPAFYGNWEGETLDALFERMRSSMPQEAPGSLSRAQNADVLAHVLKTGGYPAGQVALDPQAGGLTRVKVLMYRP